ncbi:MAG: NlpC/P60 family protein [Bacteroidales bacterium]
MQKAICKLSVVPLRRIPSDKSEMVSQLLFGELCDVTDELEGWALIRNDSDSHEGWVDKKQIRLLTEQESDSIGHSDLKIVVDSFTNVEFENGEQLLLSFGSIIHENIDNEGIKLSNFSNWSTNTTTINQTDSSHIIGFARKFLNIPYLWGGRSIFGIDCSGFVQLVMNASGFTMPRDAAQQVEMGSLISFIEEAETADLAFFDNDEGQIVHTGILLDSTHIIHACGKVRIDSIDHYGIFNHEIHKYTHRLRIIKRL